jgi:hypothetical protein
VLAAALRLHPERVRDSEGVDRRGGTRGDPRALVGGRGERVAREPLRSFVHLPGVLEDLEVARLLAAADAVVLPYRVGGGPWNTSLHAALLQGTFVLATSNERSGYDPRQNLHWARPRDLDEFRAALEKYAGVRKDDKTAEELPPTWETVVSRHEDVYRERLGA